MKKMQMGGDPAKKKARLDKRANKVMSRAQRTYGQAMGALEDAKQSGMPADYAGAEQLQNKSQRQGAKAKRLKAKSAAMKTGGMVNANKSVSALKTAGSKGVTPNMNPKASASKVAKGKSGGTSKAPKTATPKAQYGMSMRSSMRKGGSMKNK